MKKTVKPSKKTNSGKKPAQNTKKNGAKSAKKSKKTLAGTSNEHDRAKFPGSDSLRVFLLVSVLVILTVIISTVVIMINAKTGNISQDIVSGSYTDSEDTEEPFQNTTEVISQPVPSTSHNTPNEEMPRPSVSVPSDNNTRPVRDTGNDNTGTVSRPTVRDTSLQDSQTPAEHLGTLVFVIDDAGNNLRELESFLSIKEPLTIAVLPGLPYSAEAARRIRAAGKEVILHQPMEAIGAQYPGPGAIYSGMTADEIRAILKQNITEVGPVAGINNHQGSKITMDREIMEIILAFCAENGLYFLDSRTTAETAAPAAASRMGMTIAQRDIFIDNEQDKSSMLNYITNGLTRAQRNGSAVLIGHTWSPELAPLLAQQFPILIKQGYTLATGSDIIKSR